MIDYEHLGHVVFIKTEIEVDEENPSLQHCETSSEVKHPYRSSVLRKEHIVQGQNISKSMRQSSVDSEKDEMESDSESRHSICHFTSKGFDGYTSDSDAKLSDLKRLETIDKKSSSPAEKRLKNRRNKNLSMSMKGLGAIETKMESPGSTAHRLDSIDRLNRKTLKCEVCQKMFLSCRSLRKHILKHNSEIQVKCLICGKNFSDLDKLKSHTKFHTEREFVCQSCGKRFRRNANLLRHESTCGEEKPITEQLCTLCGKLCRSKWQLQQHMMFHTDRRPFPCDYCSKRFRFRTRLAEHRRTHLGIKPHACDVCQKTFTTSSDMKKHRRRHQDPTFKSYNTENNPNKLSECKVCSEQVVNLKCHMSTHLDKDRGSCNICGKILKNKSLYQHVKIHFECAPYQCGVCNKTFKRKDNMLSHRERHSKSGYKPKTTIVAPDDNYK